MQSRGGGPLGRRRPPAWTDCSDQGTGASSEGARAREGTRPHGGPNLTTGESQPRMSSPRDAPRLGLSASPAGFRRECPSRRTPPRGAGPVPQFHWSPSAVRPVGHRTAAVCGRRHRSTVPPDRHPELADDLGRGRLRVLPAGPPFRRSRRAVSWLRGIPATPHPDCWPAYPRFFRSTTSRSTSLFPRPLSERSSHGSLPRH